MSGVVIVAATVVAAAFLRVSHLLYCSQPRTKSFSDLPDDVLLEIFTCLNFYEIIAIRQTCRRCYRVSKTRALWSDVHRWITEGSEDWRMSQAERRSKLSSRELESSVLRMVQFERNWSRGNQGVQRTTSFQPETGYSLALIPGGRWFLTWSPYPAHGVVCYDLDATNIQGRVLLQPRREDHTHVGTMGFCKDEGVDGFAYNLAIEFCRRDQFAGSDGESRDLLIWRLALDQRGQLTAKLAWCIPVFRCTTPFTPSLSVAGNVVLRHSHEPGFSAVLVTHRLGDSKKNQVTGSILIPSGAHDPLAGFRLLPNGQIIAISESCVEMYSSPHLSWQESPIISDDIPRSNPFWVYNYQTTLYNPNLTVSPFILSPLGGWFSFSIHNGRSLLDVRVRDGDPKQPEVMESTPFAQMGPATKIGWGTSRMILNTIGKTEVKFISLDVRPKMSALRAFAGLDPNTLSQISIGQAPETLFLSPEPTSGKVWMVDEQSGRVVCDLGRACAVQCRVFHFTD